MLISKDKFIEYLNEYKEAYEEQQRFHKALEPFFERPICRYRESLMFAYERLLVDICECDDEDGIFSWWLYTSTDADRVITVKEKDGTTLKYDVSTAAGLYDYLSAYYGKYNNTVEELTDKIRKLNEKLERFK